MPTKLIKAPATCKCLIQPHASHHILIIILHTKVQLSYMYRFSPLEQFSHVNTMCLAVTSIVAV